MQESRPLAAFYEGLDEALSRGDGTASLMERISSDFRWEISLPDRLASGDRAGFEDFLNARARASASHRAAHRVVLGSRDGGHEVVMGYLEADGAAPSPFVAAASVDGEGRLTRLMLRRSALDL